MIPLRNFALSALLFIVAVPLAADYWTRPAKTPDTDVTCATCADTKGKKSPGYPAVLGNYVGRYLDSESVIEWQQPFRAARARNVVAMPSLNRIYFIIGSAVAAYDLDRFFQRVASNEALGVPTYRGSGPSEQVLGWDSMFYAESEPSWITPTTDGYQRLYGIDVDDQGYVYTAYSLFGWGIIKDTSDGLKPVVQLIDSSPDPTLIASDVVPNTIAVLKGSNGSYYVVISDATSSMLSVYDVTNRSHPQKRVSIRKSMLNFAKSSDSTKVGIVTTDNRFELYTTDALIAGGTPLVNTYGVGGAKVGAVACDGTNFYITSDDTSNLSITTYTGAGSKVGDFRTGRGTLGSQNLRWGNGFLVWSGISDSSSELRLFKAQVNDVSEIDLSIPSAGGAHPYYFKNFYINNNSGRQDYVAPPLWGYFWDSTAVKSAGKSYLVVTGMILGDVYELKGSDSLTITTNGSVGTPNPNRPAGSSAGPFYGDPIGFTATTTGAAQTNITWDFGNPEAAIGADGNSGPGLTATPITHRYSGLTSLASLPTTRTVAATSVTNANVNGSLAVTLNKPSVSIGIAGRAGSIAQASQLSSVPIVAGDAFVDTSDGSVQSHFDNWTIDTASTKLLPNESVGAGACAAQHTLSMTAHYGPYTGTSPNETSLSDMPIAIGGATYSVRPFAASIATTPASDSIAFTAAVRVTSDTTILSASQANALQYRWQLVDASNNVLVAGATGSGQIPTFTVPKSAFTSRGIRARLTLTSATAVGGACAGLGMETFDAFTAALNGPDPVVDGGCASDGGPPCSFSVHSASGADPNAEGWTYVWSASPNTFRGAGNGATFAPTFTVVGTYTVSVTATNGIGSSTATKSVTVTKIPPICPPMIAGNNVFISYQSNDGSCSFAGGSCSANVPIAFNASSFQYDFGCDTHTFTWSFGDGATGNGRTISHSYGAAGTYTASVTIKNSSESVVTVVNVTVGTPPPHCVPMVPNVNVFPTFSASSGCTNVNGSPCKQSETITFGAGAFNYSFAACPHTFSWSFGDGTTGSGQFAQHAYVNTGTFNVSLTIANDSQTVTMTIPVQIAKTKVDCLPLVPGVSVFITYSGPKSQCSYTSGAECSNLEDVTFNAAAFNYSFDCAKHDFAWDFDDHTAQATGQSITHNFAGAGTYHVKLFVTVDGGTPVTIPVTVKVRDDRVVQNCGYDFTVEPRVVGGTLLPNEFVFTVVGLTAGSTPTFNWDFGDGTKLSSTAAQQTHAYADSQVYTVTLTVPGTNCLLQHQTVKPRHRAAGR